MDVTGYHQISPGDTMLQLRNAMGRCGTRHHFCVCGQVVKLFPVSISFLTLVLAAFAKFKTSITVFLKDVWFSTMFQHLKNWSSQKLGTYPQVLNFRVFSLTFRLNRHVRGWFLVLPAWCTGMTFSKGEQGVWDSGLLTFQQPLWLVGKQFWYTCISRYINLLMMWFKVPDASFGVMEVMEIPITNS